MGTIPASVVENYEHYFPMERNGRLWLSLHVRSRAKSASSPPIYTEGDAVSGRVELHFDRPEKIKGITITMQGGTTAVGQEEILFLNTTQPIWSPDPNKGKAGERLEGNRAFPFKFILPKEVTMSLAKNRAATFKLPPNFSERASPSYIDYKLVVNVKRGMFQANVTVSHNFAFIPLTSPPPPSTLRQMAYRTGSGLIGPDRDRDGWKVVGPAKLAGTLFNVRRTSVECELAIATPLAFPLRSPIPLFLTLRSVDQQALDILSNPTAVRVFLVRSLANGSDAVDDTAVRRSNNFFTESAGQAVFWPSSRNVNSRTLQGELEVKHGVKPSFVFPRLSIRYTIDLLPFVAPGFQLDKMTNEDPTLLSEPITICTTHTPGVVPRSYMPPGYEQPVGGGDYNRSMGMLENGNQRFIHHGR
ncbi:hypothetical protein GYMLUDRAFT_176063 [Collybiopsis luxurians FD-317 M1]|uniref:Arrestin-like N-terminal domain-containing protein n=1 Tax=Collybiopsis luxurians FD-317 M1 TaxID=944289 RepID=A0A0D0AX32_9AGAR|nr:hypothetical protein GYMLUDRAFT_176063 [Collybiopsis luxurians FD-317 M1]